MSLDRALMRQLEASLARREAELVALLHASSRAAAESQATPHEVQDFKDIAARDAQSGVDIVAVWHAAKELAAVSAARRRIANDSYGTCQSCGDAIEASRLLALPAAALCAPCQAEHEGGESRAARQ